VLKQHREQNQESNLDFQSKLSKVTNNLS